jgi:hypothetical protein
MSILIFGAGNRVLNDVLPALDLLINQCQISVVRKNFMLLSDFPGVNCAERSLRTLGDQLKDSKILIDTPISSNIELLTRLSDSCQLRVLEDNGLIPWIDALRISLPRIGFLLIHRALYYYHGMAFLNSLLRHRSLVSFGFTPKLLDRYVTFILAKPFFFVIWIHFRNYRKSNILWWNKGVKTVASWSDQYLDSEFQLGTVISGEELRSLLGKNESLNVSLTHNMRFWKRVGLYLGLKYLILDDTNNFPTLGEVFANEERWFPNR